MAVALPLIQRALTALADPKVRAQIVEYGRPVVGAAKNLGPSVATHFDEVGDRFGQKGLELREAKLRALVADLSSESPALAEALRPVTESLIHIRQMLRVSATLSFFKRKKAHMTIDNMLDDLDRGLIDATSPGAQPNLAG